MNPIVSLLVTTNYSPEPTGIALYTSNLAEMLCASQVDCRVLTSLPHYPWWRVPEEFADQVEGVQLINGVPVFRANHLIPSSFSAASRVKFEWSLYKNLKRVSKNIENSDLLLACIPTVAALYVALAIKKRSEVPLGVIVQDLSGKGASQSGQTGGSLVSKIAEWIEVRAIKKADAVAVVSESMRTALMNAGIKESAITLIPNYSVKKIEPMDKYEARKKLGWEPSDFIAVHSGNMGAKQDLENIARAADFLQKSSDIRIYLVGHGNQESKLKTVCLGKHNISVLPAVSDSDYSALLSAADLLLVNERYSQLEMSLPSKLTSYLYSERPVLAAVPHGGATWKFLDGIAELVEAGRPELLAKAITELSRNDKKREDLASKGLAFAKTQLNPEIGRQRYLNWVNGLVESQHG